MKILNLINQVLLGENLDYLTKFNNESIDLIYIDPPFYTNINYDDFSDKWKSLDEYLKYMKIRINEMYRILKNTGSFYLHCDWHCSHYIKIELDKIFGYDNLINEIIWYYPNKSHSRTKHRQSTRSHNTIFFYAKSKNYTYNPLRSKTKIDSHKFPHEDNIGKYRIIKKQKKYKGNGYRNIHDVWKINFINPNSPERKNYNTQKPEEILKRIIISSSNKGDLVADFFCGSGTTLFIAKKLNRNYFGCDINQNAIKITKNRLKEINRTQSGVLGWI